MSSELVMQWMNQEDLAYKVISYAQNQEDILLARAFPESDGFYLDVGANHPIFHSVTKLFSTRGWQGINIEPSPLVFDELQRDRPRDINLNVGVSDVPGTLTFYDTPGKHGWSSFHPNLGQHYRTLGIEVIERSIPVRTLAAICADHAHGRTIDFLKVDAEGFERQVLLGADLATWRPRVLIVENAWHEAWEPLVLTAGYHHALFDGINRYYVRVEDEALLPAFATAVNVLDNYIPFEYWRMIQILNQEAALKFSLINAIRHDAPRVARKVRSMVRRLTGGRQAG